MAQNPPDTRERLLETALELFSQRGYHAVSIRDIASAVGIREASIYHHFSGKEALLQAIFFRAEEYIAAWKTRFDAALSQASRVSREDFITSGIFYLEHYFLHPDIGRILDLLAMEKRSSPQAAEMYQRFLFAVPLEHQQQAFAHLIRTGCFMADDARLLADEYQALVLYVFQQKDSLDAAARLATLLDRFYLAHCAPKEDLPK
ncbi:MAG: helix-turn-helix domain containing protein [Eubacteriales bacterium]|nr:helix-turn-helix domain containing protein [Eubacteriales bacterium]